MNDKVKSLSELIRVGDTSNLELNAFSSNNLGNSTLIARIPAYDFYRMSKVANERSSDGEPVAQRKLDTKHANDLARYILKAVLATAMDPNNNQEGTLLEAKKRLVKIVGTQPYVSLQPLVVNLRSAGENGYNLKAKQIFSEKEEPVGLKVWLGQQDILYVVDGQHRRYALQMVIDFLDEIKAEHRYPTKKSSIFPHNRNDRAVPQDELNVWYECDDIIRKKFTVNVEIHLGLDIDKERQLFHDLNNLGKNVEKSLALEFDNSNPINIFIKNNLIESGILHVCDKDKVDWESDEGELSRKDIVGINARLILNSGNINSATPNIVESRIDTAQQFWNAVSQIPGFGERKAKCNTIAAQPVVLKALAKLTYDFAFGKNKNNENFKILLEGIGDLDFSHNNPLWRYYQLTEEERSIFKLNDLEKYLPDNEGGNRDIGNYDGRWMRFGSKHNDIFPIIGDMIRWKLGLPSRNK
ncbi:MAG: DNA sulfur modification protein DndB [Anaeroplasmataceae bacterium]